MRLASEVVLESVCPLATLVADSNVQIWFQNRRQNSRRRSRPLQPHELYPRLENLDTVAVPGDAVSPVTWDGLQRKGRLHPDQAFHNQQINAAANTPDSTDQGTALDSGDSQSKGSGLPILQSEKSPDASSHIGDSSGSLDPNSAQKSQNEQASQQVDALWQTSPVLPISEPGYIANPRDAPFSGLNQHALSPPTSSSGTQPGAEPPALTTDAQPTPKPNLNRPTPRVRLSMTFTGSARVKTGSSLTPSPPRSQPLPTIPP